MLQRFSALREKIATFLISKNKIVSHFHDPLWVSSLGFLVDNTTHLNDLNLNLQGKNQLCNEMYWHITAFERRLCLWKHQLQQCNYAHFPNLQQSQPADPFTLVKTLGELKVEFVSRLADFRLYLALHSGDLNLFGTPFNVDVGNVPQSLHMELIELQCNELLKNKFNLDDVSWSTSTENISFHQENFQTWCSTKKRWHRYSEVRTYASSYFQK